MLNKKKHLKGIMIGCATNQGNCREKNQDRILCCKAMLGSHEMVLACVCDGIGSFQNSEISSEMMIRGIDRWFQGILTDCPNLSCDEIFSDLELTIHELNELVFCYKAKHNVEIGCTMSLMLCIDRMYYIFHAGDSRVYCHRGELVQITRDEVAVREVNGVIRSLLANYVGKSRELWINKLYGTIEEDDFFIVGTDGLYKRLTDEDICLLKKAGSDNALSKECGKLLQRMIQRGEKDNLSCAVIHYPMKKRSKRSKN